MLDPLARYPEMMSTEDLARFLGCSRETAAREMQRMPYVTIGNGRRRKTRRVLKMHVRKQYGIPEPKEKPFHIVR